MKWSFRSSTKMTYFFLGGLISLGFLFLYLTFGKRHFSANHDSAFWLGSLLLLAAFILFMFYESSEIEVQLQQRQLKIMRRSPFGGRSHYINFHQVDRVEVRRVGRASTGIFTYHLVICLKDGRSEKSGYFEFDSAKVYGVAQSLARDIGCSVS